MPVPYLARSRRFVPPLLFAMFLLDACTIGSEVRTPAPAAAPADRNLNEPRAVANTIGQVAEAPPASLAAEAAIAAREALQSALSIEPEPVYEPIIPLEGNPVVERMINNFLDQQASTLAVWAGRAAVWFPMIERIFDEVGVPDELKYLALTESGLNPVIYSSVGAAGMWQFMPATARSSGLTIDSLVDERLDPELATRAAAEHLLELHELYEGNWLLAIAGYNCSPRCIYRAIERAGASASDPDAFWAIYPYLPRETRDFVPRFVAAALLVSDPVRFGIEPLVDSMEFSFDVVEVSGALMLDSVARLIDSDMASLQALNPALRRGVLPVREEGYSLRVPVGTARPLIEALQSQPVEAIVAPVRHVVRSGDTLGAIANRYSVALADLRSANGISGHIIRPGDELLLPGGDPDARVAVLGSRSNVSFGQFSARAVGLPDNLQVKSETESEERSVTVELLDPERFDDFLLPVSYRVNRGDTLSAIADAFNVSVAELRRWNSISGSTIFPGQELIVQLGGTQVVPAVYTVRAGDNLAGIASRFGVRLDDLRRRNDIAGHLIYPGQALFLPN